MSRAEAADALDLILTEQATPAQIGAFLIAHRIRRPELQELTGMLDTYRRSGPVLRSTAGAVPPVCFGMPFDGRTRRTDLSPDDVGPAGHGQPVVLQGGDRMPIKYGAPPSICSQALISIFTVSPWSRSRTGSISTGLL